MHGTKDNCTIRLYSYDKEGVGGGYAASCKQNPPYYLHCLEHFNRRFGIPFTKVLA
ncbi:MAG: hypothetical protein ACLFM7_11865 [Bacteroidales bacterium]